MNFNKMEAYSKLLIEWNEKLSVGNYAIDEQHKELINIINDVVEIIGQEQYTFSNLLFVVHRLDDYVDKHFKYEELLMDKVSFPEKRWHIQEHDFARQKMDKLNVFDQENFEEKFLHATLEWLVVWLINHIMYTDKKLEPYL